MTPSAQAVWKAAIRKAAPLSLHMENHAFEQEARTVWEATAAELRNPALSDEENPDIMGFEEFLSILNEGLGMFFSRSQK